MNATSVLAARIERHAIHQAVCRYRSAGLACSTCTDLAESATRARRVLDAQIAEGRGPAYLDSLRFIEAA